MKNSRIIWIVCILLLNFLISCKQPGEVEEGLSDKQAAAIKLGYALGSKLSLIALPIGMREKSFAELSFSMSDLGSYLTKINISESEKTGILNRMNAAFTVSNPIAAAEALLNEMNRIKVLISIGAHPKLMHVMRIGFVLGHTLETAAIVTRGNPTEKHITTFVALTQKFRTSMPEDIRDCGLPENLLDSIRETNFDVKTVDDLKAVMDACRNILTIVEHPGDAGSEPKGKSDYYKEHQHPQGFTFKYPSGWSVTDDKIAKTVLLMPPGKTLQSPGAKAIYLVMAHHGYNDPLAIKSYLEKQLLPAKIESFIHEPFTEGSGPGAILHWKVTIKQSGKTIKSGLRAYVVIMKDWAVYVSGFGPSEMLNTHENTIKRVAASFIWQ